jgi:hypothetical protein
MEENSMKKAYIAPVVSLAAYGNLECAFASGVVCGRERSLSNWLIDSGSTDKVTLSPYCKNANSWMQDIDNNNLYGTGDNKE